MAKSDAAEHKDPARRGSSQTETPEQQGPLGFFSNTVDELRKVVWPNRQQLIGESTAVLLIVVLFAFFIWLVDKIFRWAAGQVF
jgi:preprotein translocase subunit SecE